MVATAVLFIPLIADSVVAGAGTHLARGMLEDSSALALMRWTLWAHLVRSIGWDIAGLGAISMLGGVACTGLVAAMANGLLSGSVRDARARGAVVLLAGLSFALTPGILRASTRIGPATISLVVPFAGFALLVSAASRGRGGKRENVLLGTGMTKSAMFMDRLKSCKGSIFLALVLLGLGAAEWVCLGTAIFASRGAFRLSSVLRDAGWSLGAFAAVGALPVALFAALVRRGWLEGRFAKGLFLGVWALAVAVMGSEAFVSSGRGWVAGRIAAAIVANAKEAGRSAVASDGTMDDLFAFLLPENLRLITLAREHDARYGRELMGWMRSRMDDGRRDVENLAFAAELGAVALLDEWALSDRRDFEAVVTTPAFYFPTVENWREAYGIVAGAGSEEPLGEYLRQLMGACGNEIGCRLLEQNREEEAWRVFWEVVEKVDRGNYTALVNLSGMMERGCRVPSSIGDAVVRWRGDVEARLMSPERIARAARTGGRLYVDPAVRERREEVRRAALGRRELLAPQARRFVEKVQRIVRGPGRDLAEARAEIRKAIGEGLVRIDAIGGQLLMLDRALGDRDGAESDAIEILRIDRHHAAANAVMGTVDARRGDWVSAERHLRRAGDDASVLNDLAYVLTRTDRAVEAVGLARRAVAAEPENWNFRETLGEALIRADEVNAGWAELEAARRQKAKGDGK